MSSNRQDYRVKFQRKDPFMDELKARIHKKIKERGDHLYAGPMDYLKVLGYLALSPLLTYYFSIWIMEF